MNVTPIKKKLGRYNVGDEFELPDRAARLLIKVGKVQAVGPQEEPGPRISPVTGKPVRNYQRRDMQAEK